MEALERSSPTDVIVDASGIDYCDGSGIGLLIELHRRQQQTGKGIEIRGLRKEFLQLLNLFGPDEFKETQVARSQKTSIPEEVGLKTFIVWEDVRSIITFSGELVVALVYAVLNPGRIRWKDVFLVFEKAGVNALPIIVLINFLIGLSIGLQSIGEMQRYGAEIMLANIIGLSVLRELGPLMTAIIMAGRTSSTFAAEIGTMKVNEEIDALTTMGIDPVRFLVVTRVIATVLLMPLLTIFADLAGIFGGAVILYKNGYSFETYFIQVQEAAKYIDMLGGLFKSLVFAMIVAGIGCLCGLRTKTGASAVGESTTRAVVGCIILVIIMDSILAGVYRSLNIY